MGGLVDAVFAQGFVEFGKEGLIGVAVPILPLDEDWFFLDSVEVGDADEVPLGC